MEKVILGKVYIGDNSHVLFQVYQYKTNMYVSEILLLNQNGTLTLLISDANSLPENKLHFSPQFQIEAVYRLRQDCEKTIYWTDNNNIPRRFVIGKTEYFSEEGSSDIYHADANKFCLFSTYRGEFIPKYDYIDVVEGGYLTVGSYNISVQYLDEDFNPSEWISTTDTIIIYNDTQSADYSSIRGSTSAKTEYQNFGVTSKAIQVKVSNLDTNFKYIRFALIQAGTASGLPTKVLVTPELLITEGGVSYSFTEQSLLTKLDLEEIIAPHNPIYQAKTIEQIDNMLLLGNTKGKQINWCKFQKYASKIKSNVVYRDMNLNKISTTKTSYESTSARRLNGDFKKCTVNVDVTTPMPGETYSYGIIYIFEDGFRSPVFHIPGPPPTIEGSRITANSMKYAPCQDYNYVNTTCEPDYWGMDYLGTPLENSPIRHHRFPLRTEINKSLLDQERQYRKTKKRKFYFYIQFRRRLYPSFPGNFHNHTSEEVKHLAPGRPGDFSTGSELAYTYYNRFKKNFGTIKLILRLTYSITGESVPYKTELIEHEVSADEVIKPKGNQDNTDTWGIKYLLPEVPENYTLIQAVVLEIPQVENSETEDESKQIWFTTGDRSKADADCGDTPNYCLESLAFDIYYETNSAYTSTYGSNYAYSWGHVNDISGYSAYIYRPNAPLRLANQNESLSGGVAGTGGRSAIVFHGIGGTTQLGTPKRLVSYINPTPVIYMEEYYDIEDTTDYTTQVMGVNFSNIEIPAINEYLLNESMDNNRIVGYEIVVNERTEDNKSILDSGILLPIIQQSTSTGADKFVAAGLVNPIFTGELSTPTGGTATLVNSKLNQYNFALISAEHKFLKKEYNYSDIKLLIQGVYDINNKNRSHDPLTEEYLNADSQHCLSSSNDGLWIQEGVEVGTTYDPTKSKKGEVDYDGWDLHLLNKHVFLNYQGLETDVRIENIEKITYLPPLAYDTLKVAANKELPVYNLSMDNAIGIVTLSNTNPHLEYFVKKITNTEDIIDNEYYGLNAVESTTKLLKVRYPYVYLKREIANPYAFFNIMPYYPIMTNPVYFEGYASSSVSIFAGDTYVSPLRYRNDIFFDCRARRRDRKDGFWQILSGVLGAIVGIVVTVLGAIYTGGTLAVIGVGIISASISYMITGINIKQATNVFMSLYNAGLQATLKDDWVNKFLASINPRDDEIQWLSECLDTVWLEGTVNLNWRNGVTSYVTDFENPLTGYHLDKILNYLLDKLTTMDINHANGRLYMGFSKAEFYQINPDYLRRNREKIYKVLSSAYDCCSECQESNFLRTHYSQQSFQEEKVDNYRVFLPNNYTDVPGEKGAITKLVALQNNLIALTDEGIWQFPKNQQREIIDQVISFVGTGSYFKIPPVALVDENNGSSAGCSNQWGVLKAPNGLYYISEKEGTVYELASKLTPISTNGMNGWFKSHLRFQNGNVDNPSNSTGFIMGYDAENDRILITKQDIDDTGWTISYNLRTKAWTSFHSYIPHMYIYDNQNFYSWIKGETIDIWKHNVEGNFQNFYNTYYPHVIEYVAQSENLQTNLWESVNFYTEAIRYITETVDTVTIQDSYNEEDLTFTNAIFYNGKQCSGLLNLVVKNTMTGDYFDSYNNTFINPLNTFVDKNEKNWALNNFRDLVDNTNVPIWVANKILNDRWMSRNNMNGYIDKSIHTGSLSLVKSWFNQEPFRDKYLIQRFFLNNSQQSNLQLLTNFIINQNTISNE